MDACDQLKTHSNHAAALIVQGKHQEAFEELQLAIKNALSSCSWEEDVVRHTTTHRSAFPIMAMTGPPRADDTMFRWPIMCLASHYTRRRGEERHRLLSMSSACAVVLYNMGLCCHLSLQEDRGRPANEQEKLMVQAESLYLKSIEVGMHCNLSILNLALSSNLMDISFTSGDLSALHVWLGYFTQEMDVLPRDTPRDVFSALCRSHMMYASGLVAARAARTFSAQSSSYRFRI